MSFSFRWRCVHLRVLLLALALCIAARSQAQVSVTVLPTEPGSGVTRLRKASYTNTSLTNGSSTSFQFNAANAPLCTAAGVGPLKARKVLLTLKFSANSLVTANPGTGQSGVEMHNMGGAVFSGKVGVQLGSNAGPSPQTAPINLSIDNTRPEQTFVLDLTQYFNATILTGQNSAITAALVPNSYQPSPAASASNFRLSLTLEETYTFAPQRVSLPAAAQNITRADGVLEQDFTWDAGCLTENYQLQLLKLTREELAATPPTAPQNDELQWRNRATTLEMQTTSATWRAMLAEGYGTYYYRIRGCANAPGGVINPENWSEWSPLGKITLSANTAANTTVPNLSNLNWIYNRTFTEGGRVAEKMTFANGLFQPRQTLTRLASSQQVIGLQTLQDYVGRDALQSLPIPIPVPTTAPNLYVPLTFSANLLGQVTTGAAVPYQAADFDTDTRVTSPAPAVEKAYYSSTYVFNGVNSQLNEGVPDAQQYPFARTLFSRDGTNRVREQGSAGPVLGLRASSPHTVRTFYASVAQQELTRLMGREAPLADKTYKVITTDPNNVSTVTYQTQDGKTIATALSGSGSGNLAALPSAAGAASTIREVLTDKTDFNSVGSVSRKILVVTEPNTDVTVEYRIYPTTFQDECQTRCTTCDYTVTITGYYLDEAGGAPTVVYTDSKALGTAATCPVIGQLPPLSTGHFITGVPGTYVLEKKVTAFNSATGASSTYLDDDALSLRAQYETYKTIAPWPAIMARLNPINATTGLLDPSARDLTGFYQFLADEAAKPNTLIRYDGTGDVKYYDVPFGCAAPGAVTEVIRIPVLTSNCGLPCNASTPGFEALLATRWPTLAAASVLPRFTTPGAFDAMVVKMLADPQYANKCAELRTCWTNQLESYLALVEANTQQGISTAPDLSQGFLECAWSLLPATGVLPDPPTAFMSKVVLKNGPDDTSLDRYHYAVYDASSPEHLACLRQIVGQPGLTSSDAVNLLPSLPAAQATSFYWCSQNSRSSAGTPQPTSTAGAIQQLAATLRNSCEERRGEFRASVIAFAADPAHIISLTPCDIEQLTDDLVRKCQLDATLSSNDFEPVAPPALTPTKLTASASLRLRNIMVGTAQVSLRDLSSTQTCAAGYDDCPNNFVPGASPGVTASVQPSAAAYEMMSYADALIKQVRDVAAVQPLSQRGPANLLGCAPAGEGFGEKTLNHFSFIGPISGQDGSVLYEDKISADAVAGRQHYWTSILDDRSGAYRQDETFNAFFFAQTANGTIYNSEDACTAGGDDVPGIPKLPTLKANAYYYPNADFLLYNPKDYSNFKKDQILSISPPYAKKKLISITNAPLTSSRGIYVLVTILNPSGIVEKVEAEIRPRWVIADGQDPDAEYHMFKMVWRTINTCNQEPVYGACLRWDAPQVSVLPPNAPAPFTVPSCQDVVMTQLASAVLAQQQQWIDTKLAAYRARYAQQCVAPANLHDELTLSYSLGYHHYTLYYYDRGGNLLKTVPPAGIRALPANADYPPHKLVTNYKYNSLNQLVEQTIPDGGTTNFYYNRKGQLRYSLNDKQRAASKYSYTAYDALGRVIQVGESTLDYSAALTIPLTNIESPTYPSSNNSQATTTVYTTPVSSLTYPALTNPTNPDFTGGGGQRYLNNRVSYSTSGDGVRTAYSYDPHGNVEWLVQDIPGLNEQKFVRYEYDLISNKVLRVAYQEGRPDQFFHRYRYDDDNRLLAVQTSADGQVWEQDAEYSYYAHGPLKRMVLGDDQVQALDYAYTLQGWLKAVNHPNLTTTDAVSLAAGKDGQSNGVAADAFGMVLGYYKGDYSRTGTYLDAGIANPNNVLREPDTSLELFNGNIATWSSRSLENGSSPLLTPVAESYRYDQLNRLLGSERSTFSGSAWSASSLPSVANPTSAYATRYSYDANGNLQTLQRKSGSASQLLDDLKYTYNKIVDPLSTTQRYGNQLQQVNDPVSPTLSDEDVDNQPMTTNYEYDEVGNLRKDNQSGVANIAWTPYGKIAQVTRTDGTTISYVYDAQGNRVSKSIVYPAASGKDTRTTYYVRDASGNMLAVYDLKQPTTGSTGATLTLVEQPLYGSARLGERRPGLLLTTGQTLPSSTGYYVRVLGQKLYELTDHLGNVRAVVMDEKTSTLSSSTGLPLLSSIKPVLSAYYNYYPFGQLQPGRYGPANLTANDGYRFGFNGKEKDNNGELGLTSYDFGARIYNPGLGNFLSIDPATKSMPNWSAYSAMFNNPIAYNDPTGCLPNPVILLYDFLFRTFKPQLTNDILKQAREKDILNSDRPYVVGITRLGRIYEDAVLRSLGEKKNTKVYRPVPTSPRGVEPDAVSLSTINKIDPSNPENTHRIVFPEASFVDAKFKGVLTLLDKNNTEQLTIMIDVLANMKGAFVDGEWNPNLKATDYGAAVLTIITPQNTLIDSSVRAYATSKGVKLRQRRTQTDTEDPSRMRVGAFIMPLNFLPTEQGISLPAKAPGQSVDVNWDKR